MSNKETINLADYVMGLQDKIYKATMMAQYYKASLASSESMLEDLEEKGLYETEMHQRLEDEIEYLKEQLEDNYRIVRQNSEKLGALGDTETDVPISSLPPLLFLDDN